MLEKRKAYETNLQAQLALWKADIDVLQAKARRAEVSAKVQYDKTIDSLQRTHAEAGERLRNLQDAGDEAWEGLKTGTEKAWTEFRDLFHHSKEKH
ncbi:MAG TPA: coiled coil domain-containing protein [Holophagaceae bacterium]|nr:coiled coil domain-containing protein [Holophagaceae bacterium]